ncbi:unnamed protein product, partial [Polarella glacialis]
MAGYGGTSTYGNAVVDWLLHYAPDPNDATVVDWLLETTTPDPNDASVGTDSSVDAVNLSVVMNGMLLLLALAAFEACLRAPRFRLL